MDLAYHKACHKFPTNMKSDLERHAETELHNKSIKKVAENEQLRKPLEKCKASNSDTAVAKLESRITIFIAENNLALSLADQLIPVEKCWQKTIKCL